MPYDRKKLTKVSEFLYRYEAGADALATVKGSAYFNDARDMLKRDDVIVVIAATRTAKEVITVTSVTGAVPVTTI
jgi:DNA-binding MurR/RpiR family transcriptional regulator